jgi:hypothetical protein
MRSLVIAAVVIATVSDPVAGKARQVVAVLPPVFIGAVQALEPPDQPGGWTLQVITRGGFEGRATELTIRSDSVSIHPDTLVSLNQRIHTVTIPRWTVDSRLGICSDCVATLIVLTVRQPNGLVQTHTAFWDATTKATIPEDLRRIHDLAVTIRER